VENDFGRIVQQSRSAERNRMIDCTHDLSITRQAKALNISRGSIYYAAPSGIGSRPRVHATD
jgi:putative transposase